MDIEFCPELQLDWSIEEVQFKTLQEIKITLIVGLTEEYPSPHKRHGKDIMSWPTIYTETNRTEFYFNSCVYFNIRDDMAPGLSENDVGQGKTFQRLLNSELLVRHSERSLEGLYHYRIVTNNEVIDVISHKTPDIIKGVRPL